LSLVLWVGATFALLWLWGVWRSKLFHLLLKFLLDLNNIYISRTQWCDVQKIHFYLNVSMQTTVIFEHRIMLRVFDTQFGTHGMENIGEIWYFLVPFLT
jgi:hypothetical protein